jgi:outer membrane protein, multidrug efflux system
LTSRLVPQLALLVALTACTSPSTDRAATAPAAVADLQSLVQSGWWQDFGDSQLSDLVARGLAQNLDIATALSRVDAAEAVTRATGLNAQLDGNLTRQSARAGGDDVVTTTTDTSSLSASYVFDLFGKVRLGKTRAKADLDAAQFDAETARLAFLSALIGRYIDARYYQEALALTERSIATRRTTVDLVMAERAVGLSDELDVARAEADLASARATLPDLKLGFDTSVFAIATLLAEPADPIMTRLSRGAPQPVPRGKTDTSVPADVLRNRPDVLADERRFASAAATAGIAAAELYPSLTLSGSVTERSATSWSFGPVLSLPILNRGRLAASRDEAQANAKTAELTWRSAVLAAVEDVQIAASTYRANRREAESLTEVVATNVRVLELSRATYEGGTTSLLDLLEAERSKTSAELSRAQSTRSVATSWAKLQIAIGRGAKPGS